MDNPFEDAPLFHLFWENSSLTPSRGLVLRERIATDAAQPYRPYRPVYSQGSQPLPPSYSSLEKLWEQRHSGRDFATQALTAAQLSNLLRPFAVAADGHHPLASGGAKYPLQVYAVLLNVDLQPSLAGQLVWYNPDAHGLVPLGAAPNWEQLKPLIGVDWLNAPAVVFFLIARSEGHTGKYGERGGRFMLLEAGAHMLALDLEVTVQSLAGVSIGAFMDNQVLALFQLDTSRHHAVLCYACGVAAV